MEQKLYSTINNNEYTRRKDGKWYITRLDTIPCNECLTNKEGWENFPSKEDWNVLSTSDPLKQKWWNNIQELQDYTQLDFLPSEDNEDIEPEDYWL